MSEESPKNPQVVADTSDRVAVDEYDPHIVPAETAARKEREGDTYKQKPTEAAEANPGSIHTTGGYTVDKEGLLNNYAIEPEMYINTPGDLREEQEELTNERKQELEEINEDKKGQLNLESDKRGKGEGII
jgi:hypothetical protein